MPSSLATVLSLTLASSACPPVSVLVPAVHKLSLEAYIERCSMCFATCLHFRLPVTFCILHGHFTPCLLLRLALTPFRGSHFPALSLHHLMAGCRKVRLLSMRVAFQVLDRSRITQGGRTFPWNPWAFGVQDSHLHLATHTGILTSISSICSFDHTSMNMQRSPTIDSVSFTIDSVSFLYPQFRQMA